MALTTMLNSCGHETSDWPLLHKSDLEFGHTYQTLLEGHHVTYFHLQDALLCHLGHLCVPSSKHAKMIWQAHYSRAVGNFKVEKIVAVLQKYFYWLNLQQDVGKYIRSCTAFAINKSTIKKQGLYTLLPTPSRPWESISMDYMLDLHSTKHGNYCVFLVVDRFSKMAIMVACKKNITVEATAKLFFEWVWVHFGIPQSIISDRDSRFLSPFGPVSSRCWTTNSLSPQPSILKLTADRGCQQDDHTHSAHVQLKASTHMGREPPLCST